MAIEPWAASNDFRPTAPWAHLALRARMLRAVRDFFEARGFLEVETPILSADTVVDRHLDPFWLLAGAMIGVPDRLWMQTSPEFAMKRLLAAGAPSIYQVSRVFRRGELGPLHNPEFTMVEWYQLGAGPDDGMLLLSDLSETLLGRGPAERISYGEAFGRHTGLDPHEADPGELSLAAGSAGIAVPESLRADDRDGWLDLLLVELVQPCLGHDRPAIVYDYPASQAALARVRPGPPDVAERFELYVAGIELANGYHELIDPAVLRARNCTANSQRQSDGGQRLPEESRLLAAMESGLPPSVGVALGFDRAVMLAAGASCLAEVIAFPIDRA